MARHKFEKGNPGKPKGAKSKLSESFYQDCLAAYNDPRIGGLEGLIGWITSTGRNRLMFYSWLAKTIPANVAVGDGNGGPLRVQVERVITTNGKDAGLASGD
jgi:hypothetical protein